ncbi:MAG TPA: hypothetical protein VMS64_39090 [Candidatus Methylomirabilis sp.]|nr:hypothetical protein [Candidatus Methylomirabilis sp.]
MREPPRNLHAAHPAGAGARAMEALDRLTSRAWFSYGMLLLLQGKVLWGIQHRDLAVGDESGYYNRAFLWFKDLSVDIVWSPLYTAYLGTLMHLTTDPFVVTTLHRIIVVVALDVMVLALMRRLLPSWIAWLVAAWWAVLPVTFDTVSTVHLFAVVPVVAAWLLILSRPSPWARGSAIAVLVITTVLVRNEYVLATGLLAGVCLWWEARMARPVAHEPARARASYVLAYGVPFLAAVAIVVFFYSRTVYPFPELLTGRTFPRHDPQWSAHSGLGPKHTYNMCQVYAVGYQQRHPEWTKNAMLDCQELMQSTFGIPIPSLLEMLRRNPAAVLHHFWWNVTLIPGGTQLLLFNASAGRVNPDYFPVQLGSLRALALSVTTAGIAVYGLLLLSRDRRFWWEHWLRDRALGWLAMLCVLPVAGLIIPTQRPRPSYLLCQGIALMASIGLCVFVISRRWPLLERAARGLPILMLAMLIVVPSYYPAHAGPRPLLALYERLAPFETAFNRSSTVFLVSGYRLEVHGYVGHNYFTSPLIDFDYSILRDAPADRPLPAFLDEHGINLFYVDEALQKQLSANPIQRALLTSPETVGWKILASHDTRAGRWMLLEREPASR